MDKLTLYFDESGFTGENLLSNDQKTFAYASVNLAPSEAEAIVERIVSKYNIQNGELKAVKLIRRDRGKQAILEILDEIQDNIKVSVHDKKFALVAHFFEYVFEPVLAKKSSIFYQHDFASMFPDYEQIDLTQKKAQLNTLLFEELIQRSENGIPVLDNIEDYILLSKVHLEIFDV